MDRILSKKSPIYIPFACIFLLENSSGWVVCQQHSTKKIRISLCTEDKNDHKMHSIQVLFFILLKQYFNDDVISFFHIPIKLISRQAHIWS